MKDRRWLGERHALLCTPASDQVSQLGQGASRALGTIREWRDSFAPIEHVLSSVPFLIPTPRTTVSVSVMCRHWGADPFVLLGPGY